MNDKELDEAIDRLHLKGCREHPDDKYELCKATQELLKEKVHLLLKQAELRGMRKARDRVLRRTEIPADAKNPTRDHIVMIGEECARIINEDIAELEAEMGEKEG